MYKINFGNRKIYYANLDDVPAGYSYTIEDPSYTTIENGIYNIEQSAFSSIINQI